jgi:FkbM family methyltransferase
MKSSEGPIRRNVVEENISVKYGLKQKWDGAGNRVDDFYAFPREALMVKKFEEACLELGKANKPLYSMIELGSNQAYYSMLFKAILGKERTNNIMVEPYEKYMPRGKENFALNRFEGTFLEKSIGDRWQMAPYRPKPVKHIFSAGQVTVDELLEQYDIQELDMLHSDIDGAELIMLEGARDALSRKCIDWLFVSTHNLPVKPPPGKEPSPTDFHLKVLEKISQYGYQILEDHREPDIGGDRMIVARRC